jgi:Ras-related protein Rab-6A
VDFFSKTITVFKDNTLKLQIWDSAGQERYKSLIPSYVRGASIIFILYDISSNLKKINFLF